MRLACASSLLAVALCASPIARADSSVPPAAHAATVTPPELASLRSRLLFRAGSAELLPESGDALAAIARWLAEHPRRDLTIEVHTDGTGAAEWNLRLSQQRADAIRTALLARGVAPVRLRAIGYGETRPVASNATAAGRARNRRIELHPTGE